MQITGIQTPGARGLASVSAIVSDPDPVARAAVVTPEREQAAGTPRPLVPEAVVFPRDGKPVDRRPVRLRHQRASERYRQDGRGDQRGTSDARGAGIRD